MSDLDNLQALKRMLEHKEEEESKATLEREKKFLADATRAYLGEDTPLSSIQGYDPNEMLNFLNLPTREVQQRMGGEWLEMADMAFEAFAFTMKQKIQKSTALVDWNS